MTMTLLHGDVRQVLSTLPADSFDCCVTSPPYWGLRDYGVDGQIGLESTMQAYLETMVGVCREVRRVLKPEGTFWLNIGDSYARQGGTTDNTAMTRGRELAHMNAAQRRMTKPPEGLKHKDLCMIPNRLAILLQEDGWYVRSEIIWAKPNPMPESVRDRPTGAHEKIWLLTKSAKYFYDADAISEESVQPGRTRQDRIGGAAHKERGQHSEGGLFTGAAKRNARNVWQITPRPYKGAHFATFPPELVERCIKAGCPVGGSVLDPFGGSGTTGMVANQLGRDSTLIELNLDYIRLAEDRIGAFL
jgi:DNA modification methylase